MTEPIPVRVTRYACPCCSRTHSGKAGARRHIARCWWNPEARGCKTCKHFEPAEGGDWRFGDPGADESCAAGVNLAGSPECQRCNGFGFVKAEPDAGLGTIDCPDCRGKPEAVKAGPIVHCTSWEAQPDDEGEARA